MRQWKSWTAALCAAVLLCGFSVPAYAYADGGEGADYGDPTMTEETQAPEPEPTIPRLTSPCTAAWTPVPNPIRQRHQRGSLCVPLHGRLRHDPGVPAAAVRAGRRRAFPRGIRLRKRACFPRLPLSLKCGKATPITGNCGTPSSWTAAMWKTMPKSPRGSPAGEHFRVCGGRLPFRPHPA